MTTGVQTTYRERADELLDRPWGMLIGGEIVPTLSGRTYEDTSPADGRFLARLPFAEQADVDRVVAAAQAACDGWRRTSVLHRGELLQEAVRRLREHSVDLGLMDAVDSGNPAAAMIDEVEMACVGLEYARGVAMEVKGETLPSPVAGDHWLLTRREPYGVCLRITAFNHPILFAAQKIGAPLMTGNTLILKVPQQTALAPLLMGEILRDVFPPGVLNVVSGSGSVAGEALVRHPVIKRISLIGGTETGQRIQASAAETGIKVVTLELGGKNPMIVFPDADLGSAARGAIHGMNFQRTQGQSCGSTTRLFLHEAIHDDVLARVAELAEAIRVGDPLDPDTEMGCLVSERQLETVLGYIETGLAEGARLVCGGGHPFGLDEGCFVAPTVFADVTRR